ncbi:MAG: hypothetical protein ACHQT8_03470 [Chlamydiales bacterium]
MPFIARLALEGPEDARQEIHLLSAHIHVVAHILPLHGSQPRFDHDIHDQSSFDNQAKPLCQL